MAVKTKQQLAEDVKKIQSMTDLDERDAAIAQLDKDTQHLAEAKYIPQEEKPLIDVPYLRDISTPAQWYGGLSTAAKTLDVLSTPIQYATAPFVQAGKAASQLIQGKPVDEFVNPITHPLEYAKKYGSTQAIMETLPIGNEPISEMIPENKIGQYLKKEFPKASEFAKTITPNAIASIASDVAVGSKVVPSAAAFAGKASDKLMRFSESKIPSMLNKEMLADQIISGHATNIELLNELKNSGKFDEVRDFFLAHPELNKVNSAKALDEITGDVTKYFDEYGRPKSTRFGGLISRLNEQQSQFIESIPVNKRTSVSSESIQSKAIEHLDEMNLTNRARKSAENFIREEVPVFEDDALNMHPVDYADHLRKTANKLMSESSFTSDAIERSSQESAAMALEKAARSELDDAINLMPDAESEAYRSRQQELSNAIRFKDLYSKSRVDKSGLTVPVGDPARGIIREVLNLKPKYIDPFLLDAAKRREVGTTVPSSYLSTAIESPTTPSAMSSITPQQQNQGRSPQSIPTPIQAQAMGRGLVENLADYEIPRNTNDILANKQAVLAKVAQVTDNPQIVSMLDDALTKHPDKLDPVIKTMSMQFPNLFVTDKYNRVDGKIFHPDPMIKQQLIQQAYDAVKNRDNLSNTEKAMLWNGLNKDGSLPDSFQ